jgi:hypothetical protein
MSSKQTWTQEQIDEFMDDINTETFDKEKYGGNSSESIVAITREDENGDEIEYFKHNGVWMQVDSDIDVQQFVEINALTAIATITIPNNVNAAYQLYCRSPVFKEFVHHEIRATQKSIHGKSVEITRYAVRGFLHDHKGSEYTIDIEDISARE